MNTEQAKYEQAIGQIERCYSGCAVLNSENREFVDFVLSALREKKERENPKPCNYCEGVPTRYRTIRAEGFYQVSVDDVLNPEMPVNYCPNCGRKLEPKEAR